MLGLRWLAFPVVGVAVFIAAYTTALAGPSLVFDGETGKVIKAEDAGAPWYPASLTKLMTAYVVFHAVRDGKIAIDDEITISERAARQPPSKIGLPAGSRVRLDTAVQALIVRSGNDFAVALAEAVGGSEEAFVRSMNEWAQRLGMTGSYFANPHGLPDPRQVTTARDMGLLAKALIDEFPEYSDYYSMQSVRVGRRNFRARNGLLRRMEGADGMKTGFICASGYNLVASATREGRQLVAVVLGARSGGRRTVLAQQMLEDAFAASPSQRAVDQFASVSFSKAEPEDMKPVVCKTSARIGVAPPSLIREWGADFGRFASRKQAAEALRDNLLAMRHVVYSGRGAIVDDYRSGDYAALMAGLDRELAERACAHLERRQSRCSVFAPGTFTPPVIEQEIRDMPGAVPKPRPKPDIAKASKRVRKAARKSRKAKRK